MIEEDMVFVPAGSFIMGSDDGDEDERPTRQINVPDFWIDRTEVTNAQFATCVAAGSCFRYWPGFVPPHYGDPAFRDHPAIVDRISWAKQYCRWRDARLPSEMEWEKAARGDDSRTYPWGEEINCDLANYESCVGDTTAVGSYPAGASPYGALDMAGNVREWVISDEERMRGGSYLEGEWALRVTDRQSDKLEFSKAQGFRCASDNPPD
jgi:formylglycine-generating enzyme required for sulfatase activity